MTSFALTHNDTSFSRSAPQITNPVGWWKCTNNTRFQKYFEVGKIYPCIQVGPSYSINGELLPVPARSHRIIPSQTKDLSCDWSPFWEHHNQRFCYEKEKLDFEFLRPFTHKEESEFLEHGCPEHAFDSLPHNLMRDVISWRNQKRTKNPSAQPSSPVNTFSNAEMFGLVALGFFAGSVLTFAIFG